MIIEIFLFLIIILIFFSINSLVKVRKNQRAGVFRLGRFIKVLPPGYHLLMPFMDRAIKLDLNEKLPGWRGYSEKQLEEKTKEILLYGGPKVGEYFLEQQRRGKLDWKPELNFLVPWLINKASIETGVDLTKDENAHVRIIEQAQLALQKIEEDGIFTIEIPFLTADVSGPKHFQVTLDKDQLKKIIAAV